MTPEASTWIVIGMGVGCAGLGAALTLVLVWGKLKLAAIAVDDANAALEAVDEQSRNQKQTITHLRSELNAAGKPSALYQFKCPVCHEFSHASGEIDFWMQLHGSTHGDPARLMNCPHCSNALDIGDFESNYLGQKQDPDTTIWWEA